MNAAYEYDGSVSAVMLGFSPQAMQLGICSTAVMHGSGLTRAPMCRHAILLAPRWQSPCGHQLRLQTGCTFARSFIVVNRPSQCIKEQQALAEWLAHSTGYLDGLKGLHASMKMSAAA